MSDAGGPEVDVTFLVPTLNRGRYVLRTVTSCLQAAAKAGLEPQVVVVDSSSDDGSWEALVRHFGSDRRVELVQNSREAGPTASWLEAARLARGRTATFVWSDDYVSSHFLEALEPEIDGVETHLCVGSAVIRDVECDDELPEVGPAERHPLSEVVQAHLGDPPPSRSAPVSPACSLFSAKALRLWAADVERLSQATPLRERLMWQSAIGPDVLVYAAALSLQHVGVPQVAGAVAQFSEHPGSITIGSNPWPLRTGYWLARVAAVEGGLDGRLTTRERARIRARLLLVGLRLAQQAPSEPVRGISRRAARAAVLIELRRLLRDSRRTVGAPAVMTGLLRASTGRLTR